MSNLSRYILNKASDNAEAKAKEIIADIPYFNNRIDPPFVKAKDLVEVVRCKNCKHWAISWGPASPDINAHWCIFNDLITREDWFCADGERKDS